MVSTASRGMLEAILDAAVDAIVVIDANARITQVNRSAIALFGYDEKEFQGRNVSMLMPEPWASEHDRYIAHYQRTRRARIIGIGREVEGRRRDGSTFPMHLAVSEFEVDGAVHYNGIIHDLSKRKAAENALARAQKLDAMGQLTGGVAHDFNNLLTVITGNLELLEMRLEDPALLEPLRDAMEAAELGADLTARLLAFAKRSVLEPRTLDPARTVATLVPMLKRTVGPAIEVKATRSSNVWSVRADPGQLESAVLNLSINARDAMPSGGRLGIGIDNITLDAGYAAREVGVAEGDYVRISVSDDGTGMEPATLERAFEPFFTTKDTAKGTGLGLAMVYGFARQSGGTATIYSEVGTGTTVNIYLPRQRSGDARDAGRETLPLGTGQLVLVVEDDEKVRRLTVQRLEALGYRTRAVRDGGAALDAVAADPKIALVFTDLVMPGGVSGLDVADTIARTMPHLPVLMTSGYSQELVDREGDAVAFDLLRKPYRQADLARAIAAALGAKG